MPATSAQDALAPSRLSGILQDSEAVRLAQQGDPSAFERLYELHSPRVYSLCLRMVGNAADAHDLTQDAFLQLFRKIRSFRGESAFSTWLHRIVVNIVLMRLRRRNVKEVPLEADDEEDRAAAPVKEIGVPDPFLAGSIDRMRLENALAQLPPGYRAAFVLHDVHGYEHKEIAKLLGCSVGNSKSQLHKARMRLRRLLTESRSLRIRRALALANLSALRQKHAPLVNRRAPAPAF